MIREHSWGETRILQSGEERAADEDQIYSGHRVVHGGETGEGLGIGMYSSPSVYMIKVSYKSGKSVRLRLGLQWRGRIVFVKAGVKCHIKVA